MPADGPPTAQALLAKARASRDDLEARILLAAAVARIGAGEGVRVVLTGGTAADFYVTGTLGTSAAYPTLWHPSTDIDVIVLAVGPWKPARLTLLRALEREGFQPRYITDDARIVDVPDFPYTLELVSQELGSPGRDERTMTLLVDGSSPLDLRSPENVVLAYAESGWHLRHHGDWSRALAVYAAMKDRLDVEWMRLEAARRGQVDVLERVLRKEPLRTGGWSP